MTKYEAARSRANSKYCSTNRTAMSPRSALSQLPSFAKMTLGADSSVVVLFLAAFSIGVGVGSTLCGRLMHGEVSARYVPLAALGMTVFSLDLGLASQDAAPAHMALIGVFEFL